METADRLAGLDAFAAVVEKGSFSAAADALGVAKSTVSKHVRRLEKRLGAQLLHRTTRQVRPTEAGAAYYDRIAGLLDAADEAAAAVARLQLEPRGKLRVSAPMSFGHRYVVPMVVRFAAAYPDVELDLDLSDRRVDLVREGFDLAVRIGPLADSSLRARKLCDTRNRVVGAPTYFARRGTPRRPRDLEAHACLRYAYQVSGARWRFRRGDRRVDVAVTGPLRSTSGDALRDAAIAGIGVALLPDFLVDDAIAGGDLVAVLDESCLAPGAVHAVFPHRAHVPAAQRAFLDMLADALAAKR